MSSQTWWYVARSGGIVAWSMLAISMFWGLALSSRFLGKRPKPNWMLDLHRFVGGLAVIFTAIHVAALVLDSYIPFGPVEILIPFTGDYHPIAVGWGVIAMYMLVAVEITSLLRKKLKKRTWRTIHYLSYPLFGLSTVHLWWAGTDRRSMPLRLGVLVATVVLVFSTLIRIVNSDAEPAPRRRPVSQ